MSSWCLGYGLCAGNLLVYELRAGQCGLQQAEEFGCSAIIFLDRSSIALNATALIVAIPVVSMFVHLRISAMIGARLTFP
jgi:hypothetical protein